jgi:signal transduction histidine kinase
MRVHWPDLVRTTSFRLALLYAGLFAVSALTLFAVIYWAATATLVDQIDAGLEAERAALEAQSSVGGTAEMQDAVTEHMRRPGNRFHYRLQDTSGRLLAGDLPPEAARHPGYHDMERPPDRAGRADADNIPRQIRAFAEALPDGAFLVIAEDAHALDELRELIARAFAWGAGATLLLAALGGGVMSAGVLRRVEAINRASERVMAGDLTRRIPVRAQSRAGDEFDRLAVNLNRMLDRIEGLVEGLRQVSTDIAHDLRTPLGRLRRTLETARDGAPEGADPDYLAQIDRALGEADALLTTFGALLRIAQIEAGAARRGFGPIDLSAVLEAVLEVYGPAAEEKGQTLAGRLTPGIAVIGDRALLTQMVANLVENAIRHGPAGTRIELVLMPPSGNRGVEVTVSDDGPGIPEGERGNVFRRFYRLDSSRGTPGNGLGLALVAAITELHGITIRLTDNTPHGLSVRLAFAIRPTEVVEGSFGRDRI